MPDQKKLDSLYMDIALRVSEMSYAVRKKVGAVLVNDENIISFGWNGVPRGFNNRCEDPVGEPYFKATEIGPITDLKTKEEVVHAEMNTIAKLARNGGTALGSFLYLTLSPCFHCAKLILQSGIKRVIYKEKYRDDKPIEFLKNGGIECTELKD